MARSSQPSLAIEPIRELVDRQAALDEEATKPFPSLLAHKRGRMNASPLAFLRGAAPLFYELLAASDELREGPDGEGWIVGDLHLENFGAYRPDVFADIAAGKKHAATFNLNDFDDALIAPWRFDLLRLTTSLLLGSRELGVTGLEALELADTLGDAWERSLFDGEPVPPAPPPVEALLEQVRVRTRTALLDGRTELVKGQRRFVRGPRYFELDDETRADVPAAFDAYIASVAEDDRRATSEKKGSLSIIDCAHRVAGTGSLGCRRIAVLVEGKGGPNGAWIFDLKEQFAPSPSIIVGEPREDPAARVLSGFRACLEHPPRLMGTTRIAKASMFGRRLAPQEDKLVLRRLKSSDLPSVVAYLGSLVGTAHRRGATKMPSIRWSKSERQTVRRQAIALAGIHEALYLAHSERCRQLRASGNG